MRIDIFKNNKWEELAKATSIGSNRIIRLSQPQTAGKIRIHIYAPVAIALSEIGLYLEPVIKSAETKNTENTYNKTIWKATNPTATSLDIDFTKPLSFSAVGYLPAQDRIAAGIIEKYELLSSDDGKNWKTIASGEFSNIKANPILQRMSLTRKTTARYLRLVAKQTTGQSGSGNSLLRIAEIEVYR